jgi:hypothetical protein
MKSPLTGQWYVATRYSIKNRIDAETGEERSFLLASVKYDVTDQMNAILKAERAVAMNESAPQQLRGQTPNGGRDGV